MTSNKYYLRYDVYYPEEIFQELLEGAVRYNLLDLEDLLARSVDCIMIVLESEGTIAELGAFVNHKDVSKKLIVLVDKKYEKSKGFIKKGLVDYVKRKNITSVIYHSFEDLESDILIKKLSDSILDLSFDNRRKKSLDNPISAQNYILILLYLFSNLHRRAIFFIFNNIIINEEKIKLDESDIKKIIGTAIGILLKNKYIRIHSNYISIDKLGINKLKRLFEKARMKKIEKFLDQIRIEILINELDSKNLMEALNL